MTRIFNNTSHAISLCGRSSPGALYEIESIGEKGLKSAERFLYANLPVK